jgi:hypothetical protein
MRKFLLWVLFFNGFLVFFSWWGFWPMMVVGVASSLVAHIALAREETR